MISGHSELDTMEAKESPLADRTAQQAALNDKVIQMCKYLLHRTHLKTLHISGNCHRQRKIDIETKGGTFNSNPQLCIGSNKRPARAC